MALTIDSSDRPHLIVTDGSSRGHYRTKINGTWALENLNRLAFGGEILVEPDGTVRFFHAAELATRDPQTSTWSVETIDATANALEVGLARDPGGRLHMAYSLGSGPAFYAVKGTDGSLVKSMIHTDCRKPSLDVDSAGNPHVACWTWNNGTTIGTGISYGWFDGHSWRWEQPDPNFSPAPFTTIESCYMCGRLGVKIQVDSQDRPHISYGTFYSNAIDYNPYYTNHLRYEQVDRTAQWGALYTDIALDANDRPHVAYFAMKTALSQCNPPIMACGDVRYATPVIALGTSMVEQPSSSTPERRSLSPVARPPHSFRTPKGCPCNASHYTVGIPLGYSGRHDHDQGQQRDARRAPGPQGQEELR